MIMAKPKGIFGKIFNRTQPAQPARVPAENLKRVGLYKPTHITEIIDIGGRREFYPTESAPRAPESWISGKSYFGWVPREEKIEGGD